MGFLKKTSLIFFSRMFSVILGGLGSIIIARILGVEGKGIYTLLVLAPVLVITLGNLGIQSANIYFSARQKDKLKGISSNSLILALFWGVLLFILILIFFKPLQSLFFKDAPSALLLIALSMIPALLITRYFEGILLGGDKVKALGLKIISVSSVFLLSLIFLVWIFRFGVFGALVSWIIATLVSSIITFVLVYRLLSRTHWHFDFSLFKKSINFGVKAFLANVFQFLNYRIDILLISLFSSALFVGYYSVAVVLAELIWYIPNSLALILFPRTSSSRIREANHFTPKVCRNTVFILLIIVLLAFLLGELAIWILYGQEFLPAAGAFYLLLPGIFALGFAKILSSDILGRGKPQINAYIALFCLGINIVSNIILIPKLGIRGAAIASSIAYITSAILTLIIFLKISKNSLFKTLVIQKEDIKYYKELWDRVKSRFFGKMLQPKG